MEEQSRLDGLDFARFLALLGMVIVNFNVVMTDHGGAGWPAILAESLQGRAAATFVVLAGIGFGLSMARRPWGQTCLVTIKRAIFLVVLGMLNSLIFDADILHYYGFYFVFGLLFLKTRTGTLLVAIIALTAVFVAMAIQLDYDKGWDWDTYTYSDFWSWRGFLRNLLFNGWHPVVPWLSFLLFGIILSRRKLNKKRVQLKLLVAGATTLTIATIGSTALMDWAGSLDPEAAILFTTAPVPPMPFFMLAGVGAASVIVALCLLTADTLRSLGMLGIVTMPGRQSLTLYIAHIVIGMGTLEALGMIGGQTSWRALQAALLFCLLAVIYAWTWSIFLQRGPIEYLMRKTVG